MKISHDSIARKRVIQYVTREKLDISERMTNYIIEELRWKASRLSKTGYTTVFNGGVVKSDDAVDLELASSFKAAMAALDSRLLKYGQVTQPAKKQVRYLIDPYMQPLIYGESRMLQDIEMDLLGCLDNIGKGRVVPVPPREQIEINDMEAFSSHYQLLPCELEVKNDTFK